MEIQELDICLSPIQRVKEATPEKSRQLKGGLARVQAQIADKDSDLRTNHRIERNRIRCALEDCKERILAGQDRLKRGVPQIRLFRRLTNELDCLRETEQHLEGEQRGVDDLIVRARQEIDRLKVVSGVDELVTLRAALGLDRVHLVGQSWGGMLAMQYALERPAGLASIVVADSPADMGQWVSEANRLRAALQSDVQQVLAEHEAAGTTTAPEYGAAVEIFYRKHVCRLDPWPDPFVRTAEALERDNFVYLVMNGPSEFHVIGKLASWSILDRLHEIETPTLLISGAHDEATPAIVGAIAERIPHAEWVLFEESSHTPHLEQPDAFSATVRAFLAGVESGSRTLQTAHTIS